MKLRPIVPKEEGKVTTPVSPDSPVMRQKEEKRKYNREAAGKKTDVRSRSHKRREDSSNSLREKRGGKRALRAKSEMHEKRLVLRWVPWALGVVFLVLIAPICMNLWSQKQQIETMEAQIAEMKREKANLEASMQRLQEELNVVNSDEFIERYAHEKLGMIKSNELLYEVSTQSSDSSSASSSTEEEKSETEEEPQEQSEEDVHE